MARSGSAIELVSDTAPLSAFNDPTAESSVADAEQAFALRLLEQVDRSDTAGNVTVSPFSLAVALAMLENGARSATLTQIAATLGTSSLSSARQDQGWASLINTLVKESQADGLSMQSANALWLQKNLPMQAGFMTNMARYFATGVWQVDFAHDVAGAQQAINQWVSDHTNAKITQLFGPHDIDPTTVLVLANAIYFHAAWQTPFDPNSSHSGPFYATSGQTTPATFMDGSVTHASITSTYQAVRLPYTGGHYEALAIMPRDQTLSAFVSKLNFEQLGRIVAGAQQPVEVHLPRFTTQSYLNLNQTLTAMGMPIAFTSAADFSAMSPVALQVQSVVQRDYLSVGEKGTEAAAATGISAVPTAGIAHPPPLITFDHPFLFAIRDTATGALVFTSLVQDPSQ